MLLNKLDIRCFEEDDFDQLKSVFKEVYPANPLMQSRRYFDWQFKDVPFKGDGSHHFWILREENAIKGFLGYFPLEFYYDQKIFPGCWSLNWVSLGEGHGGLELISRVMQDYENRFFLGLSQAAAEIFKTCGIPVINAIPRWIGILDARSAEAVFKISDAKEKTHLSLSESRLNALSGQDQFHFPQRFEIDDEFFWKGYPQVKGFVRRTGAYLNWRYVDIPGHNYKIIRGSREGFAVYRIEEIKGLKASVLRILEWNFTQKNSEGAMARICKEGRLHHVILLDFLTTAYCVGAEFERLGFVGESVFKANPIPYLFRPLCQRAGLPQAFDLFSRPHGEKFNFEEWYVTKGDSDMDRIKL